MRQISSEFNRLPTKFIINFNKKIELIVKLKIWCRKGKTAINRRIFINSCKLKIFKIINVAKLI